jgi:hypothetical protein
MFSVMRTLLSLLVPVGLAACAHHGASAPAPPALRVGIYRFTERPPQSKQSFQGRVGVTNDTVVVESDAGPCVYEPRSAGRDVVMYHCGEITVSFKRTDPVATASYSVTTTVSDRQTTCAQSATDTTGRTRCVRQQTETIERQVPVDGKLHLELVAKPD